MGLGEAVRQLGLCCAHFSSSAACAGLSEVSCRAPVPVLLCSCARAELPPSEASAGVATGVREADKTCQLTFIGGLPSAASGGVVC